MNKKKISALILSGLIVLNNAGQLENVYAYSNSNPEQLTKNENNKATQVVYLENGEGPAYMGDGSEKNPYQNIRTALEKIPDGAILKIKGRVLYTEIQQHPTAGAMPIVIKKNITIEGEQGASLYLRAPIQLEADVTFRNIRLQMLQNIPGAGSTSRLNRTATIYASGHELTLDNVNTKLGTSIHQEDERPYISGGAFDGYEVYKKPGSERAKSVINIINPNSETRFATIYAGDYFKDRELDVEINLDARLVEPVIYTGDDKHTLKGDVTVKLSPNTNVTRFDKTYHEGNLDVTLGESANRVYLSPKDIRNLTLEENSRLILAEGATFNVNNLVLKNNAVIDFREMENNNPVVNGNFEGELKFGQLIEKKKPLQTSIGMMKITDL